MQVVPCTLVGFVIWKWVHVWSLTRGNAIALPIAKSHKILVYYDLLLFFPRRTSYGRGSLINCGGDSSDCKLKVLLPFFRVKSDRRATSPPPPPHTHTHLYPNVFNKKLEIVILFKIIWRSNVHTPGVDPPQPSGQGLWVMVIAIVNL